MIDGAQVAYYDDNGKIFAAMVRGNPEVKLGLSDNHFVLTFGPHSDVQRSKLFFTSCKAEELNAFAALATASKGPEDLKALSQPGAAHWKTIETVGQIAPNSNEPYVVDTIGFP